MEGFWALFLRMLYLYELLFQYNKNHTISRLLRRDIDFLPKLPKAEKLSETELELSLKIYLY